MKNNHSKYSSKWIFSLTLAIATMSFVALITTGVFYVQYSDPCHIEKARTNKQDGETKTGITGQCDPKFCSPPSCVCASARHPGDLTLQQVPMMIMLTFDDYFNSVNYDNLIALSDLGIKNENGCPLKMTFFVDDDHTNYSMVKDFYNRGHEICSHSQTHKYPKHWWATATTEEYKVEFGGQREKLHQFTGIPMSDIRGMRVPFLEVSGDGLWSMMEEVGFLYDSSYNSRADVTKGESPSWPFTLDYVSNIRTCEDSETVTKPFPGLWEVPLTKYFGFTRDDQCDMLDFCETGDGALNVSSYLWRHFAHHYRNRAPMGLFVHPQWFVTRPGSFDGLVEFLRQLTYIPDVWFVSVGQVVDWMRKPTAIEDLDSFEPWLC